MLNDNGHPLQDFRIGYFETDGEMYAPCLEWDDFIADYNNIKLYYGQEYDVLTGALWVGHMDVTYLCWEGRAVQCLPDVSTGLYTNADASGLACIDGGDPEANTAGWEMESNGLLGEPQLSFSDKYPHCLPSTPVPTDGSASAEVTAMVEWLTYFEAADTPVMYLFGYWDDSSSQYLYWGEEYGEELPIYVDRYGNLCTNMYTEADEATGRVLLAFNDGIFDRTAADIDASTAVEDYPANVANIASFMGEDEFALWTSYQK